jgi:branched-chain amino acid transport system ATP-binding protein
MNAPALSLAGLSSGYGDSIVLQNVDLTIAPGEIVALLGKNGMGKSTLLKSIMGFLPKAKGTVDAFGTAITNWPPYRTARLGIGYVPQEKALFQDLTVADNIRLALAPGAPFAGALERVEAAFPFLTKRLAQRAGTLSGGEQKMLLMSRAFAARARLILIDEITEGLQPSVIERLADVIRRERQASGASFLLVEQNVPFSRTVADRFAVLERGEIVERGETADPTAPARIAAHLSV